MSAISASTMASCASIQSLQMRQATRAACARVLARAGGLRIAGQRLANAGDVGGQPEVDRAVRCRQAERDVRQDPLVVVLGQPAWALARTSFRWISAASNLPATWLR